MKKKNDRAYSLTAKERKQKRGEAAKQTEEPIAKTEAASQEAAMLAEQKKSKKNAIIIGVVIAVSIVLILVAILVPVIAYLSNPYRDYKKDPYSDYKLVIARFNLSNGMKLEYVIEEDLYDTAATNFIFLAKNGYFDNTVFFDAQHGWLRFGGYDDQPTQTGNSTDYNLTKHRSYNYDYCYKFSKLPNSSFIYDNKDYTLSKFAYKLRADANGTNASLLGQIGVLAYIYTDTSTEFEFAYTAQATNDIETLNSSGTTQTTDLEATRVGFALNDKTIENLAAIAATAQPNNKITSGYRWRPPTPNIYIESVKVYNLAKSKWDKFDFIDYMYENDSSGNRRLSNWSGISR